VVDGLDPAGEQLVEPNQVLDRGEGPRGGADEEPFPDGPEELLDLAPAGGLAGFAVGEGDPQGKARSSCEETIAEPLSR
jgi:hypothetical protein